MYDAEIICPAELGCVAFFEDTRFEISWLFAAFHTCLTTGLRLGHTALRGLRSIVSLLCHGVDLLEICYVNSMDFLITSQNIIRYHRNQKCYQSKCYRPLCLVEIGQLPLIVFEVLVG